MAATPTATEWAARTAEGRARYFRAYYLAHKAAILAKNRQWARDHRAELTALRRRAAGLLRTSTVCVDCGVGVGRAERCRRCSGRYRYHTDPDYRARRLATTARWLARTRPPAREERTA
jgi:hypothetical protein